MYIYRKVQWIHLNRIGIIEIDKIFIKKKKKIQNNKDGGEDEGPPYFFHFIFFFEYNLHHYLKLIIYNLYNK